MSTTQPTNINPSINYADIIAAAKEALKTMENDRLSAQKDKEHSEQRLEEHYAGVRALKVEPERLEEKITELDVELFEDMVATVELLPQDYRQKFIPRAAFETAIYVMEETTIVNLTGELKARAEAAIARADLILNPPVPVEEGETTTSGEVD